MRYCDNCHVILESSIKPDDYHFICVKCKVKYPPTPSDTLLYSHTDELNINQYTLLLRHAEKDPANPQARRKCPTCKKETIVRQILLNNSQLTNKCRTCETIWVDSSTKQ